MSKFWADISTQWREGGIGSAWSNRRVNASLCLWAFFVFCFAGLAVLARVELVWPAILCFLPAIASLAASILFSYFASKADFVDVAKLVSDALAKAQPQ